MASPPFNIAETSPGDSDIVSQFPAAERTFRDIVEDWITTEHGTSGHHKIPIKTTAQKTAITDWEAGSLVYDTTLNVLQVVETIDPDVFVNAHVVAANEIVTAMIADSAVTTAKIADTNVTTAKIADDAVTFAKIQNITSDRLLGRDTTGSGDTEEISITAPLSWSGSGSISVSAASTTESGVAELATEAEMVTGTDTARVPSVSTVKNHEGVAKAWGYITGDATPALADSYRVTSVTDNETGNYTITLAVTMDSANYAVLVTGSNAENKPNVCMVTDKTTTTFRILVRDHNNSALDSSVNFVVFGTLA